MLDVEQGWVALLRAVNLGPRNKVPMAELRSLLEPSGLGNVRTYIQSGNVLFTSSERDRDALALQIEEEIARSFDVATTAILRTFAELAAVATAYPFGPDTSRTHVAFLASEPDRDGLTRLAEFDAGADRVAVKGSQAYLDYPNGVQGSRLSAGRLERLLGVPGTVRNWRTVTKLAELAAI